tara:strand:+ start:92 stop:388 length:297 start_codon:yes stop_codon:yes gene_type:complete
MQLQTKDLLSALPLLVLFTSGIFSYSDLSADASQTAEQAGDNEQKIGELDKSVNEIDRRLSLQEGQMARVQKDIDSISGDTKQILNVLLRGDRDRKGD